jgi:formylglycine-generating enzyme required for sulfatase activity
MVRRELFISYSHRDLKWLEQLRTHLKPLERNYNLERWDDSRIKPGDKWLAEIEQALARAAVALLLVSPDFVASDFIDRKEMPSLLDAAQNQGLAILWVPLRPISLKLFPQIEQYQALFSPDRTLADMTAVEQDRTLAKISETILETIDKAKQQETLKQNDNHQRVENDRLELLKAQSDAHAVEAQRWRAEAQRLAKEKEDLRLQVEPAASPGPLPSIQTEGAAPPGPALIQISADKGALVRVGNEWQQKTERITVSGYELELAKGIAITMVQIPAGSFEMGSPATEAERRDTEGLQHRVELQSFFLGQTPVTQVQWQAVANWPQVELKLNPDPARFKGANRPVERVSWEEAMEFCRRLSQRSKFAYTLPSEAQWEYACRAGSTTPFAFGETLTPELANYDWTETYASGPKGVSRQQTTEVGSFPANAWGLHDMHGNVWEWCLDFWHDSYTGAPADGSAWTAGGGTRRLLRGGSWDYGPAHCRSAYRSAFHADARGSLIGFRVCCLPQD